MRPPWDPRPARSPREARQPTLFGVSETHVALRGREGDIQVEEAGRLRGVVSVSSRVSSSTFPPSLSVQSEVAASRPSTGPLTVAMFASLLIGVARTFTPVVRAVDIPVGGPEGAMVRVILRLARHVILNRPAPCQTHALGAEQRKEAWTCRVIEVTKGRPLSPITCTSTCPGAACSTATHSFIDSFHAGGVKSPKRAVSRAVSFAAREGSTKAAWTHPGRAGRPVRAGFEVFGRRSPLRSHG